MTTDRCGGQQAGAAAATAGAAGAGGSAAAADAAGVPAHHRCGRRRFIAGAPACPCDPADAARAPGQFSLKRKISAYRIISYHLTMFGRIIGVLRVYLGLPCGDAFIH